VPFISVGGASTQLRPIVPGGFPRIAGPHGERTGANQSDGPDDVRTRRPLHRPALSPYGTAFLTDAIIVQRYMEIDSRLQRMMAVCGKVVVLP